jgi:hypothetical protein
MGGFGTVTASWENALGKKLQELQNKVLSHRVGQNKALPADGVNTLRD